MSHGLFWAIDGRVRLAEALHPAELHLMIDALDTPEGVAILRQELERALEARPQIEKTRSEIRESSEGQTLEELERRLEERQRPRRVRPGTVEVASGDLERGRIIRLMQATGAPTYDSSQDPRH